MQWLTKAFLGYKVGSVRYLRLGDWCLFVWEKSLLVCAIAFILVGTFWPLDKVFCVRWCFTLKLKYEMFRLYCCMCRFTKHLVTLITANSWRFSISTPSLSCICLWQSSYSWSSHLPRMYLPHTAYMFTPYSVRIYPIQRTYLSHTAYVFTIYPTAYVFTSGGICTVGL